MVLYSNQDDSMPASTPSSIDTVEILHSREYDPEMQKYREALGLVASLETTSNRSSGSRSGVFDTQTDLVTSRDKNKKNNTSYTRPHYVNMDLKMSEHRFNSRKLLTRLAVLERRMKFCPSDNEALRLYNDYEAVVSQIRDTFAQMTHIMAFDAMMNRVIPRDTVRFAVTEARKILDDRITVIAKLESVSGNANKDELHKIAHDMFLEAHQKVEAAKAIVWPGMSDKYVARVPVEN